MMPTAYCRGYGIFSVCFYFWKRFFNALPASISCSEFSVEIREFEKLFFAWDLIWSAIIRELIATTASCKPVVDSCKATCVASLLQDVATSLVTSFLVCWSTAFVFAAGMVATDLAASVLPSVTNAHCVNVVLSAAFVLSYMHFPRAVAYWPAKAELESNNPASVAVMSFVFIAILFSCVI